MATATDKLQELIKRCKCGVFVSVNAHRDYYEAPDSYIARHEEIVDPALLARMVATDTVVEVQFYPETPIGSYVIFDVEIDAALDRALACFAKDVGHG